MTPNPRSLDARDAFTATITFFDFFEPNVVNGCGGGTQTFTVGTLGECHEVTAVNAVAFVVEEVGSSILTDFLQVSDVGGCIGSVGFEFAGLVGESGSNQECVQAPQGVIKSFAPSTSN